MLQPSVVMRPLGLLRRPRLFRLQVREVQIVDRTEVLLAVGRNLVGTWRAAELDGAAIYDGRRRVLR